MYRRTVLKLPLLLAAGTALASSPRAAAEPPRASAQSSRWSSDRANRWYQAQGWPVGANFITSTAINQLEMFQPGTYDPRRIDTELGWARLHGLNTVRVFLHDQLWAQDSRGFQTRACAIRQHHVPSSHQAAVRVVRLLLGPASPSGSPSHAPTPGVHNSGWVQGPGADRIDDKSYTRTLQDYVTGIMTQFRNDDRVLGWDVWNEPDNPAPQYASVERGDKLDRVAGCLPQVFTWARGEDARQPLTSGVWDGEWADVVESHHDPEHSAGQLRCDQLPLLRRALGVRVPHRRAHPARATHVVHRVYGPAPGQYRRIDPANC